MGCPKDVRQNKQFHHLLHFLNVDFQKLSNHFGPSKPRKSIYMINFIENGDRESPSECRIEFLASEPTKEIKWTFSFFFGFFPNFFHFLNFFLVHNSFLAIDSWTKEPWTVIFLLKNVISTYYGPWLVILWCFLFGGLFNLHRSLRFRLQVSFRHKVLHQQQQFSRLSFWYHVVHGLINSYASQLTVHVKIFYLRIAFAWALSSLSPSRLLKARAETAKKWKIFILSS